MIKHSENLEDLDTLRQRIIGLGERSFRKSYYPKLQQHLRELERFRELLDQSNDAILLMNVPSGTFIDVNESACRQLSYSRERLLALSLYDVADTSTLRTIDELLKGGQPGAQDRSTQEITLIKSNGERIPVEISVRLVMFGSAVYAVAAVRDISDRKKAEERIRDSLAEKEVLLREIHHRVKNNLQFISSLLSLQSDYTKGEQIREILRDSQHRVMSMALIHERLYCSESLANIDFEEYITSIAHSLIKAYGRGPHTISLKIDVSDVFLDPDRAIPCGLIINELVSNALKYAFPDNRKGEIIIDFRRIDGSYRLIVSDNGIGFPPSIDAQKTESLGLRLVSILVQQLQGELKMHTNGGTIFTITFNT